jgi:ribonuclease BN (tRNA processing enzyme)
MAAAAEVKHLVLTHLRAGPVDEGAIRTALRAGGFQGEVTLADDGKEIPV